MTRHDESAPGDEELMRQAAAWFARMRAPDADRSRDAFEAWLDDPAHRQAYSRAAEIFALGKLLTPEEGHRSDAQSASAGPSAAAPRSSAPARPSVTARSRILAGLVGAAAILAVGALSLRERSAPSPADQVASNAATHRLATAAEGRTTRLADGSSVTLAPDTLVVVEFRSDRRLLSLLRGNARFEVFHDPRPFVVAAGGGTVTARGTVFEVALVSRDRVAVRLVSGSVDVTLPSAGPASGPASPVRRLSPGEAVSFQAASAPAEAPAAEVPSAPAVIGSVRDFEAARVADIVAEANRRSPRPIRLGTASLGEERVSGRFAVDNTEVLADRLALLFGLVADRNAMGEIVLRRP